MARAMTVFVATDKIPSRKALQAALDAQSFKIVLDDDYRPLKTRGYLPCALDGEDAGFDLRFDPPDAETAQKLGLAPETSALSLRWAGDPREYLAALGFVTALVENFDGVAVDGEELLSAEILQARAKTAAASV